MFCSLAIFGIIKSFKKLQPFNFISNRATDKMNADVSPICAPFAFEAIVYLRKITRWGHLFMHSFILNEPGTFISPVLEWVPSCGASAGESECLHSAPLRLLETLLQLWMTVLTVLCLITRGCFIGRGSFVCLFVFTQLHHITHFKNSLMLHNRAGSTLSCLTRER